MSDVHHYQQHTSSSSFHSFASANHIPFSLSPSVINRSTATANFRRAPLHPVTVRNVANYSTTKIISSAVSSRKVPNNNYSGEKNATVV